MEWMSSISYADEPITVRQVPAGLEHLQIVDVVGSAMEPKLSHGDRAIYDPDQRDPQDGQMVVVDHAGEILVRWARRHRDGRLTFVSNAGDELAGDASVQVEGTVLIFVKPPWTPRSPRPRRLEAGLLPSQR